MSEIKLWSSQYMPDDRVLTLDKLKGFADTIKAIPWQPSVMVMSPRVRDSYLDLLHTEAVRRFLGMVGPFTPITARGLWRKLTGFARTVTYRLRKAARVLRYGYDPEDS